MEQKNHICGGNTFAYSKGYIMLPIEIGALPATISVEGETLQRRSSFHVSLLCVRDMVEKYGDLEKRILEFFCSFVKDHDISFIKYTGEFRFTQNEERKSVVALCEISNLKNFSESLGRELGIDIPPQPTHVTLYTLQPDAGIGLNSSADMSEKSVPVEVPDSVRLRCGV